MNKISIYLLLIGLIWFISCGEDDEPTNEPPLLSDITFRIPEEIENGTRVGIVPAVDPDNDPLTYSIISGNKDETFELNLSSGEITVRSNEKIDFQVISQYQLTIEASDGKSIGSALITINIEEANRPPVINEQTFNLPEDARVGYEVGVVQATDPNGDNLKYEIIGGNEDGLFELNETMGTLSLISTLSLDFESKDSYILTILVRDPEELVSSVPITIEIQDATEPDTSFELADSNFDMADGLIREFGTSNISAFHTVRNYSLTDGQFFFSDPLNDFVVNGGTIGVFGVLFSSNFISFNPGEFAYVDTASTTVDEVIGKDFIYTGVIIIDGNNDGSVSINEEDIVYGITAGSIKVISNGAEPPTLNFNVEVTLYDVASEQYVNSTKVNLHFEYSGDYKYIDQRSSRSRKESIDNIKQIMKFDKSD